MCDTIILTRMYVGTYLQNNIGHEVINLFKADNGNNYIYVNKDGRINPKYNNSISAVILTRYFYMNHAGRMLHTDYFTEFVDALHLHTTTIDNSNYEVMKSRFFSKIRRILENKDI